MKREELVISGTDHDADRLAADFLRAQEVQRPENIEELRQATTSANDEAERVLFQRDRWRGMKEDDEEGSASESLYDEWVDVMLDLDDAFFDEHDGALGRRVLALLAMNDDVFLEHVDEVQDLLRQTSLSALRVYPFMHHLVSLGVAPDRATVVARLLSGDLIRQEKVHNVSVTPRRQTIIGLLRSLDDRLPPERRTNIWSLEVSPELPASVVIADPFQSENEAIATYWRARIAAAHEMRGTDETIFSLSGEKTMSVVYELEQIAEGAGDDVLKSSAQHIAAWLERKRVYYQDPDPRDFELYHLGMEEPHQLMELMRSLDVMKHFDPELFFELLGVDPSQGGRSMYFGSFLHKALFNTQRILDNASPELGEMALKTMVAQLLTLDDHVQTYAAVVSQESLKTMAAKVKETVDVSPTAQSKARALMMMAMPYSRMAIDAEVRRQLDALREASPENVVEELCRRIDDIEHPLKLAEYIGLLPRVALDDIRVKKVLHGVFGDIRLDAVQEQCLKRRPEYLKVLYDRIPLIDESREDLGFALRVRVALRDAISIANIPEEYSTENHSEKTRARQFLKGVMPTNLYREDFEAIKDQLRFWEIPIAERFCYSSRSFEGNYSGIVKPSEIHLDQDWSEPDQAFFIGQAIVGWENNARDRRDDYFAKLLGMAEYLRPDLVFLSIVAHPQGKDVAFKYFDKFCDMISAERMCEVLRLSAKPIREFESSFEAEGKPRTRAYVHYLRRRLPSIEALLINQKDRMQLYRLTPQHLEDLKELNRVLVEGKTQFEIQTASYTFDLFDIWSEIEKVRRNSSDGYPGFRLRNPAESPPSDVERREIVDDSLGSSRTQRLLRFFVPEVAGYDGMTDLVLSVIRAKTLLQDG